jgi:hypothetical protein
MAEQRRELEDSGEPQDQKLERVCPLGRVCIAAEYPGPKPGYMVTGDAFAGGRGSGVDAYPAAICGQDPFTALYHSPRPDTKTT